MNALIMQKTKETILHASQKSDTAILFFSATGKDSIVLLHLLQSQFKKVVCCFLYHVKGLNIVEPFFNWARSYGNVEVIQLPHTDLYNFKMQGLLSVKHLDGLKRLKLRDIEDYLKIKYQTEVVVYGMKISDSFVRRGMFNKAAKSDIHFDYEKYYPIVNWTNKDCLSYIKLHKLPEPLKLGSKRGSSGINFRPETILYIKEHYPEDYKKIIKEFNLIEAKYGGS